MTLFFKTLCVTFGMFSALPVPHSRWGDENMRYALAALPLVGAACGLALAGWAGLCGLLGVDGSLRAAGACLAPVLVTGGFHLDGFADTCDARASHAPPARRREILQDSHIGAFALIRVCCYLLFYFGLVSFVRLTARRLALLALAFMLERALAGLALTGLPLAKNTGLAHAFAGAAAPQRVRGLLMLWALTLGAGLAALGGLSGLLMVLAALSCFFYLRRVALTEFGGLSGDLAGWFIQLCEAAQWAALALGQALAAKGVVLWY